MEKAKILIVEDERLVAKDIQDMLRNIGHEVTAIIPSGELAIQKAREKKPDLVLMDIVLKGEIDGISAAQKIKENQGIPVIYLTAHADENTLTRAKATDPSGYLLKPFEQRELQIVIEMALEKYKKEKKIQEKEEWFANILKIMREAIISIDRQGIITFMNPHAEALTGWKHEESCGKPLEDVFKIINEETGRQIIFPIKERVGKSRWKSPESSLLTAKNGQAIPIEISAALIRDRKGNLLDTVFIFRDTSEKWVKEKDFAHLTMHDQLTGLPNELLLRDRLFLAMALAQRHRHKVALLMAGLSSMIKKGALFHVADGKLEGQLIKNASERLTRLLRKSDSIARLPSGEFILLLLGISRKEDIAAVTDRIFHAFRKPFSFSGSKVKLNIHIGVAFFPDSGEDYDVLLKNAQTAMARAKEKGVNIWYHGQP